MCTTRMQGRAVKRKRNDQPKAKGNLETEERKMYKVETRIFGNYVEVGSTDNYQEALKIAADQEGQGWLHVRLRMPNGTYIENSF